MFRVKPVFLFGCNILLMITSWICHMLPRGDAYLWLFVIPLVFIAAPFVMKLPLTAALLSANLAFLVLYHGIGILNVIDIFVLMILFGAVMGGSYLVRSLYMSYESYYQSNIQGKRREYNGVVDELENTERRGRKVENELGRISRLYEITKKLAPTMKFKALLNALFDFLEENFRFQIAHLLIFSKDRFSRGISKCVGGEDYYEDKVRVLDYEEVIGHARGRGFTPFFISRDETGDLFDRMKVRGETFMVFPLFTGDRLRAILAVEGASRPNYSRFRILTPQIALELRKVELYEQVQKLSIIDGLTEVYLRRYLMDRLEEEVDRAGRLNLAFSVAMVDVDHFKKCNDKYGHPVGDVVLKKIAERLKGSVREVDMIARYGGEEFCIVLPETPKELAMMVAERLRVSIESEVIRAFDEEIGITVSVGIATHPENGKDVHTLIENADTALYKAKRKGRNVVCAA